MNSTNQTTAAQTQPKREFKPLLDGEPYDVAHRNVSRIYKRNGAMILSRLHYLIESGRSNSGYPVRIMDGRRWVRCTAQELQNHFSDISLRTVKRGLDRLRGEGENPAVLLCTQAHSHDRACWYAVDYERLQSICQDSKPPRPDQSGPKLMNLPSSHSEHSSSENSDECRSVPVESDKLSLSTGTDRHLPKRQNGPTIVKEVKREKIVKASSTSQPQNARPHCATAINESGCKGVSTEQSALEAESFTSKQFFDDSFPMTRPIYSIWRTTLTTVTSSQSRTLLILVPIQGRILEVSNSVSDPSRKS